MEVNDGGFKEAGHEVQGLCSDRVSAVDQNEARQLQALGQVYRLFTEKVSSEYTDDRDLSVL